MKLKTMQLATKDPLSTLNQSTARAESVVNLWLRAQSAAATADPAETNIDRVHTAVHALWRLAAIRKTLPTLVPRDQLTMEPIDVSLLTESASLAESIFNAWLATQETVDPADIDIDRVNTTIHALYRLASIRKTLPDIVNMNSRRAIAEIRDRTQVVKGLAECIHDIERRAKEEFDAANPRDPDADDDACDALREYRDNGLSDEDYYEDYKNDDDEYVDVNAEDFSLVRELEKREAKLSARIEARLASVSRCPRFRSPVAKSLNETLAMIANLPFPASPQPETQNPQLATRNSQLETKNPQQTTNDFQIATRNSQLVFPKSAIDSPP